MKSEVKRDYLSYQPNTVDARDPITLVIRNSVIVAQVFGHRLIIHKSGSETLSNSNRNETTFASIVKDLSLILQAPVLCE